MDTLEKRLRHEAALLAACYSEDIALAKAPTVEELLFCAMELAARIEREECARAAEACRDAEDVPDAIRERGGK